MLLVREIAMLFHIFPFLWKRKHSLEFLGKCHLKNFNEAKHLGLLFYLHATSILSIHRCRWWNERIKISSCIFSECEWKETFFARIMNKNFLTFWKKLLDLQKCIGLTFLLFRFHFFLKASQPTNFELLDLKKEKFTFSNFRLILTRSERGCSLVWRAASVGRFLFLLPTLKFQRSN